LLRQLRFHPWSKISCRLQTLAEWGKWDVACRVGSTIALAVRHTRFPFPRRRRVRLTWKLEYEFPWTSTMIRPSPNGARIESFGNVFYSCRVWGHRSPAASPNTAPKR
jgi:hypothetical protein